MNNNFCQIISLLADGKSRSGQEIGDLLKITRSAVWKIMHKLSELGIPVERNQGKGYRFTRPVQLLDKDTVWQLLTPETQLQIPYFELIDSVESTNDSMLKLIKDGKPSGSLLLSEHQTKGRGRLGRTWHSPYAANIYLALSWRFIKDTSELSGLSQVIALALLRALSESGVDGLSLKWPNDIYHDDKKLASIVIDMLGESHSTTTSVIGVSVNVSMCPEQNAIDQPWTDIHTITAQFPDRNQLCAAILNSVYSALTQFKGEGFTPFVESWSKHDHLLRKPILAFNTQEAFSGTALGLGTKGELLIETEDGIIPFLNGTVRLQPIKSII